MKAWESKNAKRAAQGAGLTTMAVTLAACGGSDTTTPAPTTPVAPANTIEMANNGGVFSLVTNTVSGVSLPSSAAATLYINDAASNAMSFTLDADTIGSGKVTFQFADANDVVTLTAGSDLGNVASVEVIGGTVDLSALADADVNITSFTVNSGLVLNLADFLSVTSARGTGSIKIVVKDAAGISQAVAKVTELGMSGHTVTFQAGQGATLTSAQITQGNTDVAAAITALNTPAPTPVASYSVAASAASVNEGGTVTFTLSTENVAAGTELTYTLSGVNAADLVGGASALTGTVTVDALGKAVVVVELAADATSEGSETLTMTVAGASASVAVFDTSVTAPQSFTLTANTDNFTGAATDDTFNATAATFTNLDKLDGGAGTDTLNIVDAAAGMGTAPTGVTLTSIEAVNISTNGALGVVAGTAAVPQVDKVTFPTVVEDVQSVMEITVAGATAADGDLQVTYLGNTVTYVNDQDKPATNITKIVEAINTAAGKTVAYAGSAETGAVDIDGTVPTGFTATNTLAITGDKTSTIKVGMTVADDGGGEIASGARVTKVAYDGTSTFVQFSGAALTADLSAEVITFGGGAGNNTGPVAGKITLFGPEDGSNAPISFSSPAGISTALVVSGVEGNEGTVVNFTYGGQSGQYTIGASNDATAIAFKDAFNAVASNATAAVVNSGTSDYVTITADTAGTAIGDLVFVNAGANTPTVTTTTANVVGGDTAAAYDMSEMTTDTITVTSATSANLKAGKASDVDISGVTGAITVDGGKNITVSDKTANTAIDIDNAAGTVTVTDTKQGTGAISVDDATAVTITAGGRSSGLITVGGTDEVTGAVNITATGVDYDAAAGGNVLLGAIAVTGGTTVSVTSVAAGSTTKAAADTTAVGHVQGGVTVTGGKNTTSVTVNQDAAVTAVNAVVAVAEKAATQVVTFGNMVAGDKVTLTSDTNQSIVFTAAKNLTATEVASAFAALSKNATEGSAASTLGSYTNGSSGGLTNDWVSGTVTTAVGGATATVTFTTTKDLNGGTAGLGYTTSNDLSIAHVDSGSSNVASTRGTSAANAVDGVAAVDAVTGKMGVVAGAVVVNGAITGTDVLTTVTLDGFGASSSVASDALTTLNLSNSANDVVATTASTGTVTLNIDKLASGSSVSLDGGAATVTGVTVNATGTKSTTDLVAAAAKSVTVNAAVDVTATSGTALDAIETLTVTGAGKVDFSAEAEDLADTLKTVDASQNSGGVTIAVAGDKAVVTGGAGADKISLSTDAVSKAISLGGGNDTLVLHANSTTVPTAAIAGGDGIDTLSMTATSAAGLDGNILLSGKVDGFERLTINDANTAAATIDLANLGFTDYVTTSGTGGVTFADATAYAATNKVTVVINGTAVTAALPSTPDSANITAAINTAANTALSTSSLTYVAATLTDSNKLLTVTSADPSLYTITAGTMTDASNVSLASTITELALTLDKLASGGTVVLTKDGNVAVQIKDASTGKADVLNVSADVAASNVDFGTLTAANVETINLTSNDTKADDNGDGKVSTSEAALEDATVAIAADKATTLNISGSADVVLDIVSSSEVVTVNASTLTGTLTFTADGKSTGTTVTGGSGKDVLTASGENDVLIGGAGDDTLNADDLASLTGGAGNDTFVMEAANASTKYATIMDLSAGDVIDTGAAATFNTTKITLSANSTFSDYLDAAVAANTATSSAEFIEWFQFNGDTFVVRDGYGSASDATGYTAAEDAVIAIDGLVDLSTAAFNGTAGDLFIM